MKMVKQQAWMLNKPNATNHDAVLEYIERIGRVCYKSENKITDGSTVRFIRMLVNQKHWAMIEHYIFHIELPFDIYDELEIYIANLDPDFILCRHKGSWLQCTRVPGDVRDKYVVSGSATAFNYLFEAIDNMRIQMETKPKISRIIDLNVWLMNKYPELFIFLYDAPENGEPRDDIRFMTNAEIEKFPAEVYLMHQWFSFSFVTNRGVSHEIVRHRPASYAQSSTRYCNYSNDKFGNEITVIEPIFAYKDKLFDPWYTAMEECEKRYLEMINNGASPQEAREVLPNSLMTEITMTATVYEWLHFFNMRCSFSAHSEMRLLAMQVLKNFVKYYLDNKHFRDITTEFEIYLLPDTQAFMCQIADEYK